MLAVVAANTGTREVYVAALAGLVAGALSMGAGEYVSVSSQADTESADIEIERKALRSDYEAEQAELRDIYVRRGLDQELAGRVSRQLMSHDALAAHVKDDIGITEVMAARPLQAAAASALSFALGGVVPLFANVLAPSRMRVPFIAAVSLGFLAVLGAMAARAGGAPILRGLARVLVWGAVVMAVTGLAGTLVGVLL